MLLCQHGRAQPNLDSIRARAPGEDKELSAQRVFLIFTTVGLVRAPLGGVAMGFTAVVDGLAAFRRLNTFVSQRRLEEQRNEASVIRVEASCTVWHQESFDIYQEDLSEQVAKAETFADLAEIRGSFAHGDSDKSFELTADLSLRPGGALSCQGG